MIDWSRKSDLFHVVYSVPCPRPCKLLPALSIEFMTTAFNQVCPFSPLFRPIIRELRDIDIGLPREPKLALQFETQRSSEEAEGAVEAEETRIGLLGDVVCGGREGGLEASRYWLVGFTNPASLVLLDVNAKRGCGANLPPRFLPRDSFVQFLLLLSTPTRILVGESMGSTKTVAPFAR